MKKPSAKRTRHDELTAQQRVYEQAARREGVPEEMIPRAMGLRRRYEHLLAQRPLGDAGRVGWLEEMGKFVRDANPHLKEDIEPLVPLRRWELEASVVAPAPGHGKRVAAAWKSLPEILARTAAHARCGRQVDELFVTVTEETPRPIVRVGLRSDVDRAVAAALDGVAPERGLLDLVIFADGMPLHRRIPAIPLYPERDAPPAGVSAAVQPTEETLRVTADDERYASAWLLHRRLRELHMEHVSLKLNIALRRDGSTPARPLVHTAYFALILKSASGDTERDSTVYPADVAPIFMENHPEMLRTMSKPSPGQPSVWSIVWAAGYKSVEDLPVRVLEDEVGDTTLALQ
jgi:hypothetical protein